MDRQTDRVKPIYPPPPPLNNFVVQGVLWRLKSLASAWKMLWNRALSLAHCSSSWCWKHYPMSSALLWHGSFFMLMTWLLITGTSEECISKFKEWKDGMEGKRLLANMKKTKFRVSGIDLYVLKKSSKYPTLFVVVVSVTIPSSVHSACCGSTRGAAASSIDWWQPNLCLPQV